MQSTGVLDIAHVNRSELARVTGVDMAHISRVFSGKSRPSLSLAVAISNHLNISVDSLCETLGVEPMKRVKENYD